MYTSALLMLAAGSGASDAFSFAALGGVFTSVMTGNMVLLGLGVGSAELPRVVRPLTAIVAFVVGVYLTARWLRRTSAHPDAPWPGRITGSLAAGLVVHAVVVATWLVTSGRPTSTLQVGMVALAALAMGVQSASVNALAIPGAATTYFTGTLTRLTAGIAKAPAPPPATRTRQLGVLLAALTGAVLAGVLLVWAHPVAPILPVVMLIGAVVVSSAARRSR